jgi:thiamine pyrophosphokinase
MLLPSQFEKQDEWIFVGPMGPDLPDSFSHLPILCVDGGAHFSKKMDLWVGDNDSFGKTLPQTHVIRHPIEKDRSDLALAFALLEDIHHVKLHLWGFLGGRRDHELFNLGEGLTFLEDHPGSQILLYEEEVIRFHLVGSGTWKFSHEGIFSLGSVKKTSVKLTGFCHYPISSFETIWPLSSFGLSNIGQGQMTLETDGPIFLYFTEQK